MDTSETYIKMCEKLPEIQGDRELLEGDWYAYFTSKRFPPVLHMLSYSYEYREIGHFFTDEIAHCWLPRQDQLQEMIDLKRYIHEDIMEVLLDFLGWVEESETWRYVETLEQLWLAFVAKENYGKMWAGEDWVKEGFRE